jgi:hypothetical protein
MDKQKNRLSEAVNALRLIEQDGFGTKDMKVALVALIHDYNMLVSQSMHYVNAYDATSHNDVIQAVSFRDACEIADRI